MAILVVSQSLNMPAHLAVHTGAQVSHYILKEPLGHGNLTQTWRAMDHRDDSALRVIIEQRPNSTAVEDEAISLATARMAGGSGLAGAEIGRGQLSPSCDDKLAVLAFGEHIRMSKIRWHLVRELVFPGKRVDLQENFSRVYAAGRLGMGLSLAGVVGSFGCALGWGAGAVMAASGAGGASSYCSSYGGGGSSISDFKSVVNFGSS